MEEIWKSIPEFEGYYEASSLGRIRSLDVIRTAPNGGEWVKKGQILKPRVINDFGHLGVKLSVNGVKCDRTVHYLAATAFHGERPEGLLIRHLDGRPSNNAPSNLAYGTQVDNMADAIAHDTVEFGERRYNAKLTNEVVIAIRIKKSEGALNKDLAAEYGLRESLQKVGAFASIEPGSLPATDPERLRDQAELMGNLVIDAVKASRPFEMNPKRSAEVNVLMTRMAAEMGLGDDLIRPSIGIKPKIMVILDNANGNDGRTGYFMENGYDDFKAKLLTAGDLRMGDLYVTGVCKKVKDKEKDYTKDEIGQFIDFVREEINLVRPTYVLTCGSRATSLFNNKSKPSDLVGRKEYLPELDVTVFYGFNPNILYFRPEEGEKLEAILAEVAETISK